MWTCTMCILLHALSTQVPNSKTFHNVRYIHIVLLIIRPPKFHVILFGNAAEALHGVPRNNGEYQSKESDDQGICQIMGSFGRMFWNQNRWVYNQKELFFSWNQNIFNCGAKAHWSMSEVENVDSKMQLKLTKQYCIKTSNSTRNK